LSSVLRSLQIRTGKRSLQKPLPKVTSLFSQKSPDTLGTDQSKHSMLLAGHAVPAIFGQLRALRIRAHVPSYTKVELARTFLGFQSNAGTPASRGTNLTFLPGDCRALESVLAGPLGLCPTGFHAFRDSSFPCFAHLASWFTWLNGRAAIGSSSAQSFNCRNNTVPLSRQFVKNVVSIHRPRII